MPANTVSLRIAAFCKSDVTIAIAIALTVFWSRFITKGPIFYVDGPEIAAAIKAGVYVVQPPGYWLFAHLGGLFADPVFGLAFVNETCSALGALIIFLICRHQRLPIYLALLAAFAYASIFFAWLSGDIHSSYATQLLFPPLTLYGLLRYRDSRSPLWLIAGAASFAFGAGLRPSDGLFVAPLFVTLVFMYVKTNERRALIFGLALLMCLGWYFPTHAALKAHSSFNNESQLMHVASTRSVLLNGLTTYTIANLLRVAVPIVFAFWMLVPALFVRRERSWSMVTMIWIAPGLLFLSCIYMADAPYLDFMAAAVILFVALSTDKKKAAWMLALCFLWNTSIYLLARPLPGNGRVSQVIDFYAIKYCDYGIIHEWTNNNTIGHGGVVPR
jgi:hypothetical protein